ncbi:MAG: type II toxin-antitoxin system VapC family toxin [Amphiplicatus sp.]
MRGLLLDTCALLSIKGGRMRRSALTALREAAEAGAVFVSPWSAWYIALLAAKGRLRLAMTPGPFFEAVTDLPGTALAPLTPSVLIGAHCLPGAFPDDPSDRIIAATAREYGFRIVTRGRALIAYAQAGHINVIEC